MGLAQLSEKPLECAHKLLKKFRDYLSRKTCTYDNIVDIFVRIFLNSSPVIRAQRPVKEKRKRKVQTVFDTYEDDDTISSMLIPAADI